MDTSTCHNSEYTHPAVISTIGRKQSQVCSGTHFRAEWSSNKHDPPSIPSTPYLWPVRNPKLMQSIFFAIGHFLEATFKGLSALGWLPVIGISVVLGIGFLYWMNLQGKYSAKAKRDGTLI